MKCPKCAAQLQIATSNDKYYMCDVCKTHIQIKTKISYNQEFYETVYLQDLDNELKTLTLNHPHYKTLVAKMKRDPKFNKFIKHIDDQITTCHCYGGGFPQLELYFPITAIRVYDLIADQYGKNIGLLEQLYDLSKYTIEYNQQDLLESGVNKTVVPVFITFSHILEHFSVADIDTVFSSINNNLASGSCGLIYQPNIEKAQNKDWVHYDDQHLTFYNIETFTNILNDYPNITVEYSTTHCDDLLILFKIK